MKKRFFSSTEFYITVVLFLLCIAIEMKSGQFFTGNNAVDLVRAFSVPAMFCIGEMFVIITGGTDNASLYYWTPDRLRDLVERQEKEAGWEFILLGANIDAVQVARDLGIPVENAAQFACDAAGVRENFASLSRMTCAFAHTGIVEAGWKTKIGEHLAKTQSGRS